MNGTAGKVIAIKGAREHNLKDIDIQIRATSWSSLPV